MAKKAFLFTLVIATIFSGYLFILPQATNAQDQAQESPTIYFFRGEGCPHCAAEEEFFEVLKKEYPDLKIQDYEVWYDQENALKLKEVAEVFGLKNSGIPVSIVGPHAIVGFGNSETTGKNIKENYQACLESSCVDIVSMIEQGRGEEAKALVSSISAGETCDDGATCSLSGSSLNISLPFLGEYDARFFSLPLLTIVIAALDGFNPCAMWVLLFLISLLLGLEDRRKMWILGGSFILASGAIYFLFLAAWLNLFLFIGFIAAVRIIIGLVAIASGVYHLRDWYVNKSGLCKVTDADQKKKIMEKFRQAVRARSFWLALVGIVSVAIAVNMVELVCSAGLPAIYTQALALAGLPTPAYYAYLLLYIIIFMLDDMFVFVVAMVTLKSFGLAGKYSRWSSLIGGIVILILGILLIFKPGWIMFG